MIVEKKRSWRHTRPGERRENGRIADNNISDEQSQDFLDSTSGGADVSGNVAGKNNQQSTKHFRRR